MNHRWKAGFLKKYQSSECMDQLTTRLDRNCPFYKFLSSAVELTDTEIEDILPLFKKQKLKRNQYLLQEGTVCNHDYFVLNGVLRKYYLDEDKELITQFALEGTWISDWDSQLNETPSLYNIDALEKTEVLKIDKESINHLLNSNRKFQNFYRLLLQKGFSAQQRRISCLQKPAEKCYSDFVSMYGFLEQRISQTHIASFMGISRESLSRLKGQAVKKVKR